MGETMFQFLLAALILSLQALSPLADGTRISCPEGGQVGLQCSVDCKYLGVCGEFNLWYVLEECGTGKLCQNRKCETTTTSTCTTEPPMNNYCDVKISKVPSLKDCSLYYDCKGSTEKAQAALCLTGCFDPCTGKCTTSTTSDGYKLCDEVGHGNVEILPNNAKLAYMCIENASSEYELYWLICEMGVFRKVGNQVVCSTVDSYGCDQNADPCPSEGRYPIPGTNCSYRVCNADKTYSIVSCPYLYHYSDTAKTCVYGVCSNSISSYSAETMMDMK